MSTNKRKRESPSSVSELSNKWESEQTQPNDEQKLQEIIQIVDQSVPIRITVGDAITFIGINDSTLATLLFAQKVRFALNGDKLEDVVTKLSGVFADKASSLCAKTDELRLFLDSKFKSVPAEAGLNLRLSELVRLMDDILDNYENELQIMKLFKKISSQIMSRLCDALCQFHEVEKHPCNRGNTVISADSLYPLIKPLLEAMAIQKKVDLAQMLPVLLELHKHSGVNARNQQHAQDWLNFEMNVLTPFLIEYPAVDAWLDPVCLYICRAGAPDALVTAAINSIAVANPAAPGIVAVAARPTQHSDPAIANQAFNPTPCLFTTPDTNTAHECALLLRHGPTGLLGPNAGGDNNFQITRFSTNNFTYY